MSVDFVCLSGCDGIGKTSVLKHCVEKIGLKCDVIHWQKYLSHLDGILSCYPGIDNVDKLNSMSPALRSCCIATLMASVFDFGIKRSEEELIIVDSYYYKFFAKEKIYNLAESWFFEMLSGLAQPNLVVHLVGNLNNILERKKGRMTKYEYYENESDFRWFQEKVSDVISEEAGKRSDLEKLCVDGKSIEHVSSEFVGILTKRGFLI